jgi:hypothetical protein
MHGKGVIVPTCTSHGLPRQGWVCSSDLAPLGLVVLRQVGPFRVDKPTPGNRRASRLGVGGVAFALVSRVGPFVASGL